MMMADDTCSYYELSFETRDGENPDFDYIGWQMCRIYFDRFNQINHETCPRFLRYKERGELLEKEREEIRV